MTDFSISSRVRSFKYAFQGIAYVVRTQHNAWLHIIGAVLVCGCGFALAITSRDWAVLVTAITIVWVCEIINTAFEFVCDVISPQHNQAVQRAKDIAAGAVLVAATGSAILGIITFTPYMTALFLP